MSATVQITVGAPGSGKSYERAARWVADVWLPDHGGKHISNLPIRRHEMAEFVAKRTGRDAAEFLTRIQLLPPEVLKSWQEEQSGPWEYWAGDHAEELRGAHVAFDECHVYISNKHGAAYRKKWQDWLGTVRHLGCTLEFITQDTSKVAREVVQHAELRLSLAPRLNVRGPLGVRWGDWYQLLAFFSGTYRRVTHVEEYERRNGKWETVSNHPVPLLDRYFALYDSFSAPEDGHAQGAPTEKLEWERFGRAKFLGWFLRRNIWPLGSRVVMTSGVLAFFYLFASGAAFRWADRTINGRFQKPAAAAAVEPGAGVVDPVEVNAITSKGAESSGTDAARAVSRSKQLPTVVGIGVSHVVTDSGVVGLGEALASDGEGPAVQSIEARTGRVVLSDGVVLRVGERMRAPVAAPTAKGAGGVERVLPASQYERGGWSSEPPSGRAAGNAAGGGGERVGGVGSPQPGVRY